MQNSYAQICMLSPLAIFCQFTAKIDSIMVMIILYEQCMVVSVWTRLQTD